MRRIVMVGTLAALLTQTTWPVTGAGLGGGAAEAAGTALLMMNEDDGPLPVRAESSGPWAYQVGP